MITAHSSPVTTCYKSVYSVFLANLYRTRPFWGLGRKNRSGSALRLGNSVVVTYWLWLCRDFPPTGWQGQSADLRSRQIAPAQVGMILARSPAAGPSLPARGPRHSGALSAARACRAGSRDSGLASSRPGLPHFKPALLRGFGRARRLAKYPDFLRPISSCQCCLQHVYTSFINGNRPRTSC